MFSPSPYYVIFGGYIASRWCDIYNSWQFIQIGLGLRIIKFRVPDIWYFRWEVDMIGYVTPHDIHRSLSIHRLRNYILHNSRTFLDTNIIGDNCYTCNGNNVDKYRGLELISIYDLWILIRFIRLNTVILYT